MVHNMKRRRAAAPQGPDGGSRPGGSRGARSPRAAPRAGCGQRPRFSAHKFARGHCLFLPASVPLFFAQVAVGVGPAAVAAPTIWAPLLATSLRPV